MIKLTLQDLQWEELNEDKDLCGFDGSTNAASDGPPRRGNTSGAGSIAHYQGPCWIISEQRDPVTGTNKHILHFPIRPPLVATSTAQINVNVYLIIEVAQENVLSCTARSQGAFSKLGRIQPTMVLEVVHVKINIKKVSFLCHVMLLKRQQPITNWGFHDNVNDVFLSLKKKSLHKLHTLYATCIFKKKVNLK